MDENYTNQQVVVLSEAGLQLYLVGKNNILQSSEVVEVKTEPNTHKRRIQKLEEQLAENDLKISRLRQLMNVPIANYYYQPID